MPRFRVVNTAHFAPQPRVVAAGGAAAPGVRVEASNTHAGPLDGASSGGPALGPIGDGVSTQAAERARLLESIRAVRELLDSGVLDDLRLDELTALVDDLPLCQTSCRLLIARDVARA